MNGDHRRQNLVDFLNTRDVIRSKRSCRHRLAPADYADPENTYFFTVCARQHSEPFQDTRLSEQVIDSLLWRRDRHQWRLYCFCLMPDHLHFVAQLPEQPALLANCGRRGTVPLGILDQLGDFKKYTTCELWWPYGGSGQLWQRSSYDRILGFNRPVAEVISYVLNNPVRKGLSEHWQDYPYSRIVDEWMSG